ncbi:MAG: hypothetical protein F6K42_19045 [Leptolyngbya sp. SIO1D8]|nr:hypothetical protein [Leptolyngbya sp. SIO1D8]
MSAIHASSQIFSLLTRQSQKSKTFWLSLSIVLAIIYGLLGIQQAFNGDYVVQDDARQHIFWMQRYMDPELFPNDLLADYFQAVAPVGYSGLYKVMAMLGVEPDFFSKILPPFLGVIAAIYSFLISLEILPIPFTGFLSSFIFSQNLWCSDELSSATPRAFLYPLILAFLYYFIRKSHLICLILIGLQTIFYPQISLISLGLVVLSLIRWQAGRISLSKNWKDYLLFVLGFCLILGLVLYTRSLAEYGPVVTRLEAQNMPEFQSGGRNSFFRSGVEYWFGERSGIMHRRTFTPVTTAAGLMLPLLLWLPWKTKIRKQITPNINCLVQVLLVSFLLFALAHLLLFQLHLPNRYVGYTNRVLLSLAAGPALTILLEDIFDRCQTWKQSISLNKGWRFVRHISSISSEVLPLTFLFAASTVILFYYPLLLGEFPKTSYYNFDDAQPIYEFFAAQPKDIMIASFSDESSNLSTFSARSTLVSREHGLAYHKGYYGQFRQRAEDLIRAQYSDDPAILLAFIQTYGIDFWLLDDYAFQATYISNDRWLNQFQPMADEAVLQLSQGRDSVLQQSVAGCKVLRIVLDADCTARFAAGSNAS